MERQSMQNILVIWRGKHMNVEVNPNSNIKEFGQKLLKLTNVKSETMRLLVPQSTNKGSKLITPFSDEHSSLSLQEAAILEGKAIRMMGVFVDEIEEVSLNSMKPDLRIAGFDEEEKRLRRRLLGRPQLSLKLPQGAYIFCDFRTLHIPGIELNPPASEALRRMHMLACDPGIIAIMNKHHWRIGIMTEMAPVGYVGISPKCILGFNKNHGEEISLRLRTDDLKGFRKYESIKKTLLHELAHMVYSEHDANFFALDKQLNQEASTLDWTKSRSHTLSGRMVSDDYEDELHVGLSSNSRGQKLGGTLNSLATVRASSVAAAYHRFLNASTNDVEGDIEKYAEPNPDDTLVKEKDDMNVDTIMEVITKPWFESSIHDKDDEPDPDDCLGDEQMSEPDPDDSHAGEDMVSRGEPDPDDFEAGEAIKTSKEPDHDDSKSNKVDGDLFEPDPDDSRTAKTLKDGTQVEYPFLGKNNREEPDPDDCGTKEALEPGNSMEPDFNSPQANDIVKIEPDPDDHMVGLDNQELQRIEEPVATICNRLQRAIEMLRSEVTPLEATSALQTLFKIIRNVIEHPDELKFRRLRKANPLFQRNVANYRAAMEVLAVVGFCEDVISDEVGRAETYMVLKRNDPGLLWLAKSSLEMSIA